MARRRHAHRVISSSDDNESESDSESERSSGSASERSAAEMMDSMIDLEASEDDDDSESASNSGDSSLEVDPAFPKFMQLPPELRDRVWEFFCPDLTVPQRVLSLTMHVTGLATIADPSRPDIRACFYDGLYLSGQTETLRCLSSIHRETRKRALRRAPDELALNGHAYNAALRFHAARDVLALNVIQYSRPGPSWREQAGGPAQNIALKFDVIDDDVPWRQIFPQLQIVYNLFEHDKFNDRWLRWCVTDLARKSYYEHIEDTEPAPLTLPYIICFPDTDNHPDFLKYSLGRLSTYGLSHDGPDEIENAGLSLQPMIRFGCGAGYREYEMLEQSRNLPLPELPNETPSERDESDGDGDEPDEYESEGIDDDEIEEVQESSEDELIPDPISPGSGVGTPPSEWSQGPNEQAVANLSDIEPSENEDPPAETASRRPKRRILSDSDDDGEDDANAASRPVDGPSQRKRRRVARTLDSDSETETGDPRPPARAAEEEDSEETSSSSSEESEEAPQKPLSLAERLRTQQPARPPAAVNQDDSEEDQGNHESGFSEDEEDDEHERRARRGAAFFLDEASESDDDDGEADSFIADDDE